MTVFRDNPGLLAQFRAGSRAAMEVVYGRYLRRIETLVRHGFSLRDGVGVRAPASELEDLMQEIFARAFAERARLAFDGVREYGPFLATLARNTVLDWGRRQGRELALGELPDLPAAEEPADFADEATTTVVRAYLASLPADLRGVHEARYVRGEPQSVAAAALGLSRQALRTKEAKLRAGLQDALAAAEKKATVHQPESPPLRTGPAR